MKRGDYTRIKKTFQSFYENLEGLFDSGSFHAMPEQVPSLFSVGLWFHNDW